MAISHELSSEIVAALLATKARSKRELEDLRETLLTIHATLQRLNDQEDAKQAHRRLSKKASAGSTQ